MDQSRDNISRSTGWKCRLREKIWCDNEMFYSFIPSSCSSFFSRSGGRTPSHEMRVNWLGCHDLLGSTSWYVGIRRNVLGCRLKVKVV